MDEKEIAVLLERHSGQIERQDGRINDLERRQNDFDKLEEQYADLVSTALQLENYYQQ